MRKYETIVIINPDLKEEDSKGVIQKVKEIIQGLKGEVLRVDEWGTRTLAYDVKKMAKGHFVLLHFAGTPQVLTELERNLRLMDAVLKHQTVRLDEKGEQIAQTIAGEKTSEPEKQPEPEREKKIEKPEEEKAVPEEAVSNSPPETEPPAEEPERGEKEETDT
ncbi:MAG: 30S ribosomal protein S6 [Proteobacteria bacterium]|nr:30S ribosomal protein S6 [Pseudomonadota bacterium]